MRPLLLAFSALLAVPSASASVLVADFEIPDYVVDNATADVAGQNGWTIDDPTPDLSFFVSWTYPGSAAGNTGAALGGYYDSPVGPRVELANSYAGPLVDSLTTLKFSVQASTTEFPGTDTFGFTFRGSDSSSLLTLSLEPSASFADRFELAWYDSANVRTAIGVDLFYGAAYDLSVDFSASGADATFSALITGAAPFGFSGSLPNAAGATLSTFGASISRNSAAAAYGDNYLLFDALSVQQIPEPASALLAALGLFFGARRRR